MTVKNIEARDGPVLCSSVCVQCFWKLVGKVIMVSLHFIFAFVCFRNFVSVELATKNHLAAGAFKFQVEQDKVF